MANHRQIGVGSRGRAQLGKAVAARAVSGNAQGLVLKRDYNLDDSVQAHDDRNDTSLSMLLGRQQFVEIETFAQSIVNAPLRAVQAQETA